MVDEDVLTRVIMNVAELNKIKETKQSAPVIARPSESPSEIQPSAQELVRQVIEQIKREERDNDSDQFEVPVKMRRGKKPKVASEYDEPEILSSNPQLPAQQVFNINVQSAKENEHNYQPLVTEEINSLMSDDMTQQLNKVSAQKKSPQISVKPIKVTPDVMMVQQQAQNINNVIMEPSPENDEVIQVIPDEQRVHIDDVQSNEYFDMATVKVDDSAMDVIETMLKIVPSEPLSVESDVQNATRQTVAKPLSIEEQNLAYEQNTDLYNREVERQQYIAQGEVPPSEYDYSKHIEWPSHRNSNFLIQLEETNIVEAQNQPLIDQKYESADIEEAAILSDLQMLSPELASEDAEVHDQTMAEVGKVEIVAKNPQKVQKPPVQYMHY